jgi:methylated-DNA-[protein]-cysteine S-methyltransferase
MFDVIIPTPIGNLGLIFKTHKISAIEFLDPRIIPFPSNPLPPGLKSIIKKIENFFFFPDPLDDLPLQLQGTPFQRKVWQALRKIPLGQTRTYGELADKLNTSARAIGMACRTNPLPVVIPCHRVVSATGLGGYCGQIEGKNITIKQWLLAHEQRTC